MAEINQYYADDCLLYREIKTQQDHIIYYLRNAAVKIESIDVAETIKTTKALIETEASLSLGGHGQSGYQ
jgi:hypothetical protein